MEKNYVIKRNNGSLFVNIDSKNKAMFCLHPNVSDSINESLKMEFNTASIICNLLFELDYTVEVINYNDLL